jgi:hypothetical protein
MRRRQASHQILFQAAGAANGTRRHPRLKLAYTLPDHGSIVVRPGKGGVGGDIHEGSVVYLAGAQSSDQPSGPRKGSKLLLLRWARHVVSKAFRTGKDAVQVQGRPGKLGASVFKPSARPDATDGVDSQKSRIYAAESRKGAEGVRPSIDDLLEPEPMIGGELHGALPAIARREARAKALWRFAVLQGKSKP